MSRYDEGFSPRFLFNIILQVLFRIWWVRHEQAEFPKLKPAHKSVLFRVG
jgi:hypothetical protein